MKVLFAVHDEKVSSSIVKKYRKDYKEIISYKNVYYFNAILKELQRDKTYDRIVIDEELEEFTSTSYEQKDKFIFDKLDNITDEASNANGKEIPIILICSERRVKSEELLVKIFGIGIYNAIIGNDRSTDEVCRLINKPRLKKEAKIYYRIDSDDVNYKPENENDVSEEEMQYILSYFNKLGKNEEKYVEGFRNIVSQYNEEQLRVIIAILPLHVKSVLEEQSPEYQKIVSKRGGFTQNKPNALRSKPTSSGPSETLLKIQNNNKKPAKPIVVPSSMKDTMIKKVSIKKPTIIQNDEDYDEDEYEDIEENDFEELDDLDINNEEPITKRNEQPERVEEKEVVVQQPRKRGRPPKVKTPEELQEELQKEAKPRKRGRPPKKKEIVEEEESSILPGFEDLDLDDEDDVEEANVLPGFEDFEDIDNDNDNEEASVLPGFEDDDIDDEEEVPANNNVSKETEFDDEEENFEEFEPDTGDEFEDTVASSSNSRYNEAYSESYEEPISKLSKPDYNYDYSNYNRLLSSDKKVVAFVGTSKNGTSFIVNNIAHILSNSGISTAILDATQNKNSYYIYTKNDESLRQSASESISNLIEGNAQGIQVNNNLSVYVEIPTQESQMENSGPILETLVKNHSAVLIDCDFNTPLDYFSNAQEIYLVQSMDILTIQPLTAFLRDLKAQNILSDDKIKIIVNKCMRLRSVSSKNIVGGMAFYNDPEMSFMTELFNRNAIVPVEVPFDVETYARYLDQIVDCEISTDRYPKEMQAILKKLASMVYPLLPARNEKEKPKKGYQYPSSNNNGYSNGFSNSVNNTLNNMKKKY